MKGKLAHHTEGRQLKASLKQAGISTFKTQIPLLVAYRKASAEGITAREVKGDGWLMNEQERRSSMAEKPGKYAAALAAIDHAPEDPPTVLLPVKAPVLSGKRSRRGWRPKSVLLKETCIDQATQRLKSRGDKTDFSDLMQALEAWLATPE